MSIFISIASYKDPLLVSTIFSAYNNAEKKEDLVFSICDQSDDGIKIDEITFSNQIHYEHVDPLFAKGPCWARHRAQSFFNEEDFFLQVDSHTQFSPSWDKIFIEQLEKISTIQSDDEYFKRPIITSYPRSFEVIDFERGLFSLNNGDKHTQVITYRKDSLFLKGSFSRQIGIPTKLNDIYACNVDGSRLYFYKGLFC